MIHRDPSAAEREEYDLIVVGGGFYGATVLLEAAGRGLRTLLLERNDFGSATSANSLRIVHGGLRYLQQFNLRRFRQSVQERRWFLKTFPDLVQPLPCLMPLDDRGLRRRPILQAALWMNDALSWNRNAGVLSDHAILAGEILTVGQAKKIFPGTRANDLRGAAVWYDAYVPDLNRLLMEILHWACDLSGTAINYMEAVDLQKQGRQVRIVTARDSETGQSHEFRSRTVINATGPECRLLAERLDRDIPSLFRPSIGWNVLFDHQAVSDHILALTPGHKRRTYFLVPWKGMLLAGTGHAPWSGAPLSPRLPVQFLEQFIADIDEVVPDLNLTRDHVLRIFLGFLPATKDGGVTNPAREVIIDHSMHGGPCGLYSLSGVKFTTARAAAEKTLDLLAGRRPPMLDNVTRSLPGLSALGNFDFNWAPVRDNCTWKESLRRIIREESVLHLTDLALRRTTLADDPRRALKLAVDLCGLFPWSQQRRADEVRLLKEALEVERLVT
jgi:glycerol-3-phosphate dehydrogenase